MDGPLPERTALPPMLEELRLSRNRHWVAFLVVAAVCVACMVVGGGLLRCGNGGAGCTPAQDAADGGFSFVGLLTLVALPILLTFAVRSHARFERAFLHFLSKA